MFIKLINKIIFIRTWSLNAKLKNTNGKLKIMIRHNQNQKEEDMKVI